MGYDFKPRNKDLDWFHLGAFSYIWMLKEGPGLVLGYDEGVITSTYIYIPDKKGRDPTNNEGYYIKSKECKLIAFLLRQRMRVVEYRNKTFEGLEQSEKDWLEKYRPHRYGAVRDDFIEKAYKFADWLEICGGCSVH